MASAGRCRTDRSDHDLRLEAQLRSDSLGRFRPHLVTIAAFAIAAAWLAFRALAALPNHDESQYVAASVLSRDQLIFRDFLSLQPPLHAWLMAPVAWLFAGDSFVALRLTSAAMGVATLLLLHGALRAMNVTAASALAATLLMACCEAFQFAGTIVRNDMAPAMMLTAAMLAAMVAIRRQSAAPWPAVGLLLGLAASAKLSYGPPLAFAGLFVLVQVARGNLPRSVLFGFAGAAAAGLLPMLAGFLVDREAFLYGTLEFGATAPFDWYRANGLGYRLEWPGKLTDFLRYAALGPALPALAIVAWDVATRRPPHSPAALQRRWLCGMLLAGIAAALLPTPIQRQYLLPMLPPLFALLAPALDRLASAPRRWRAPVQALLALTALFGFAKGAVTLANGADDPAALEIDRQAEWIGRELRMHGLHGEIASLSPERIASSGYKIDERFAAGPFAFRSGNLLDPARARAIDTATPETLAEDFDRDPPVAILTGYERGSRRFRLAPDKPLIAYARLRGYRPVLLPDRIGTLYIRAGHVRAKMPSPLGNLTKIK